MNNETIELNDEQIDYIKGLRDLANFLETRPVLIPVTDTRIHHFCTNAEEYATTASALGSFNKDAGPDYHSCSRWFGMIELYVYASRGEVCEKKVVGMKVVKVMKADPTYVRPETPMIEVEEVQEIVEWDCKPILAGAK